MSEKPMDLEKATESTLAKASARLLTPLLLSIIAVLLGVLGASFSKAQTAQGEKIEQIDKRTLVMEERLNTFVLHQVQNNSNEIVELKRRMDQWERTTKTP